MNHVVLTAVIAEAKPMRFTPAGLPAIDLRLESESEVEEAGHQRKVQVGIRAIAIGANAERLAKQALGTVWRFTGFLATPRNVKTVVFHIQEFQQD
ncbi:MAG: primosomal replication protein N [Curvibacter sp.]|nr:primosomal replication protein N [Curvibacter sp.]